MKKIIGYIIAVLGLVLLAFSLGFLNLGFNPANYVKPYVAIIASICIIALGIAISLMKSSSVETDVEELPIFEGEGKKRKVIGYRRHKK